MIPVAMIMVTIFQEAPFVSTLGTYSIARVVGDVVRPAAVPLTDVDTVKDVDASVAVAVAAVFSVITDAAVVSTVPPARKEGDHRS